MGAGAGGQGAATGGLQGMGVKLLTSQAGVCCPRFLADFLLLAVLLLRTLKVDTVEHLICCVVRSNDSDEGGRLPFKSH